MSTRENIRLIARAPYYLNTVCHLHANCELASTGYKTFFYSHITCINFVCFINFTVLTRTNVLPYLVAFAFLYMSRGMRFLTI